MQEPGSASPDPKCSTPLQSTAAQGAEPAEGFWTGCEVLSWLRGAAQAIECLTARFGPEDVRVARAHASLGSLHAARGAFEDARQHFAYSVEVGRGS